MSYKDLVRKQFPMTCSNMSEYRQFIHKMSTTDLVGSFDHEDSDILLALQLAEEKKAGASGWAKYDMAIDSCLLERTYLHMIINGAIAEYQHELVSMKSRKILELEKKIQEIHNIANF